MDQLIKWAQLLAPILTLGVAMIGLRAWYWQLVAKRRFEVAEQAITVFAGANDALSAIRNSGSLGVEEERVEVPDYFDDFEKAERRRYGICFNRASDHAEAFKSVRLTQILCELHISKKAADSLGVVFMVRHRTLSAAHMLIVDRLEGHGEEQRAAILERHRRYKHDLWENRDTDDKPMETDRLSQQLDAAREELEAECRPLLREQTLWEFVWGRPVGRDRMH